MQDGDPVTSPESSATPLLPTAGSFTIQKTGAWNEDGLAASGETSVSWSRTRSAGPRASIN